MIKAVKNSRVKNNLVLGKIYVDMNSLTISPKEVMFLKIGNDIIKNKYVTGADRLNFPLCGNMKIDDSHYKLVYEEDNSYLHFGGHGDISLYSEYYTTINDETIRYSQNIMVSNIKDEVAELSYDEVKDLFNPVNHDGMYVLNLSGNILSAYNKKDGMIIEHEIISKDEKDKTSIIYGSKDTVYNGYNNLLITVDNGKYDINLFKLECVGIDRYILFLSNIRMNDINDECIIKEQESDNYANSIIKDNNKVYKKAI